MTDTDAPLLVVVTGPPAAGKTTIARSIAERLRLPVIAKDTIKEALFDGLGAGDLAWSQRLGTATFGVMLSLTEDSLAAGASLVLEARAAPNRRGPGAVRDALRETAESGRHGPLDLPGELIRIDTSSPVDLAALAVRIASAI